MTTKPTAPEYLPGSDTVTIVSAPLVADDRYGAMRRDWDDATRVDVYGCAVQPSVIDEATVDREQQRQQLKVFMPAPTMHNPTEVNDFDRIEWNGDTYDVIGRPIVWCDDSGDTNHIRVTVERTTG